MAPIRMAFPFVGASPVSGGRSAARPVDAGQLSIRHFWGTGGLLSDEPRETKKQPVFEEFSSLRRIEYESGLLRATVVEAAGES